jgi:ABC-type sugar transport system substrate-binding protein
MPRRDGQVTLVETGDAVVVIAADADLAETTAERLRRAGTKTAVFVGDPGPEADDFCAEIFGTPR